MAKAPYTFAEDMTDERQAEALKITKEAFELSHNKDHRGDTQYCAIAKHIRKSFDSTHGRGWCCVVGKSFGSFVTHQMKTYIYCSYGGINVLLWKP